MVESNLPSRRGWTGSYFKFNLGGCNFILRPTLLILEPPLQIIIAQSLNTEGSIPVFNCTDKGRNRSTIQKSI